MHTQIQFSVTVPMNQDFTGPPVTLTDPYQWCIKLPVPLLLTWQNVVQTFLYHKSLITQFWTTLDQWQKTLFGPIQRLQPTLSIHQINQEGGSITLISDASVLKMKQSRFACYNSRQPTSLERSWLSPRNSRQYLFQPCRGIRTHSRPHLPAILHYMLWPQYVPTSPTMLLLW